MKLIIVTDNGEVAVITPDQLQLKQIGEGETIVGLLIEEGTKLFPLVRFPVNLSVPAVKPEAASAPADQPKTEEASVQSE